MGVVNNNASDSMVFHSVNCVDYGAEFGRITKAHYDVNGQRVIGPRLPGIKDPSTDSKDIRRAVLELLDLCRKHGLCEGGGQ